MKEEQRTMERCADQLNTCLRYLAKAARLRPGAVVVLGCSTSEVAGGRIGKNSVPELGEVLASAMLAGCRSLGLQPVFQCCEHLNRALVMEQETLTRLGLTQVNAMPVPKAGGSVPAAAYQQLDQPALASSIQAEAAIDVGNTLVGMHIRPVAVPLRMEVEGEDEALFDAEGVRVGQAPVVMAFSRLPNIGGSRAQYPAE